MLFPIFVINPVFTPNPNAGAEAAADGCPYEPRTVVHGGDGFVAIEHGCC
ncbi:hypothetical protein [Hoylesella saccharolytica]|nr:hypothetical protein [Hoylesella saccharolytica]